MPKLFPRTIDGDQLSIEFEYKEEMEAFQTGVNELKLMRDYMRKKEETEKFSVKDTEKPYKMRVAELKPRHCALLLHKARWRVVNADVTVLAEAPRLGVHRARMRANVASDLQVSADRINVKATTCEGVGAIGRAEGLACNAIVLLAHADSTFHGH